MDVDWPDGYDRAPEYDEGEDEARDIDVAVDDEE
jgi:hypothetical protein